LVKKRKKVSTPRIKKRKRKRRNINQWRQLRSSQLANEERGSTRDSGDLHHGGVRKG